MSDIMTKKQKDYKYILPIVTTTDFAIKEGKLLNRICQTDDDAARFIAKNLRPYCTSILSIIISILCGIVLNKI